MPKRVNSSSRRARACREGEKTTGLRDASLVRHQHSPCWDSSRSNFGPACVHHL